MKDNWFTKKYTQLHERLLKKKLNDATFKRQAATFKDSRSIGILFNAGQPMHLEHIRSFANTLKKEGKEVKVLAFYPDKLPHTNCPYKYFNKKGLDWLTRPVSHEVQQFIQTRFDILINLSLSQSVPLEYISALSPANLRVGPVTEKLYCYDLMIDTVNEELPRFIEQVTFFLNKMNSTSYEVPAV